MGTNQLYKVKYKLNKSFSYNIFDITLKQYSGIKCCPFLLFVFFVLA